jgi:hypothetical protein
VTRRRWNVVAVGLVAAAGVSCASDSAPAVLESESTPEVVASDGPTVTDPVDVSSSVVATTSTPPITVPTSGPPLTLPPVSLPPVSVPPDSVSVSVDPAVVEEAVAAWTVVCTDAVKGLAALPSDVTASLGEMAKVISDFSASAATVPATGLPDDPTLGVREGLTAAATSLTDAAMKVAGGDEAAAGTLLDETVVHVEDMLDLLRAFGADC